MRKISFFLKYPNSDKDTPIFLLYTCADGRLKYFTGESGNKKTWPNVNRGSRAVLNRLQTTVEQTVTDYKIKGDRLTRAALKARLDEARKRVKTISGNMFTDMTEVVDKMERGEILTPKTKNRYSAGSIKTFRFTIEFLKKFNPKMKVGDINLVTYERFIVYCQQLNYSTNYIGSQIKNWKTLGKAIGGNPIFDDPSFVKIQEEAVDVHLDEVELSDIFKLQLDGRYAKSRDWFVLDSYTGLRISDLSILQDRNHGDGLITIANQKTNERVVIPIHPYVKAILEKYKGFPPAVSDVTLNKEIKLIAEKAGINRRVLHTITKGGKRQDTYMKKWQMVSCHTARRSFITNLRKNGVPDTVVMKLTGIKSIATLAKYDKLGVDEAATIAAGHKFFN